MKSKLSKIFSVIGIAVVILLVVAYVIGKQAIPLIYLSPIISNTGDQILKPGPYEVAWKAIGLDKVVVSIIDSEKSTDKTVMMVMTSGPVDATSGSYTIEVPESFPPRTKKYQFVIIADGGIFVKSNPFIVK